MPIAANRWLRSFSMMRGSARAAVGLGALCAVLAPTSALACNTGLPHQSQRSAAGSARKIKIGALMYSRDLEYWQLVSAGMHAAAKHEHVKLTVEVDNRKLSREAEVVDTFHARGDNVLVISPLSAKASIGALKSACRYGMDVVQYNTRIADKNFGYFVGVSNKTLGEMSGKALIHYVKTKLDGNARVAVLNGDTEPGGVARKDGFLDAIKGKKGIHVVTSELAVGSPVAGANALNTALQAHPGIDVVWGWNGAAVQGAAAAAQKSNAHLKIFGIDMSNQVAHIMLSKDSPVGAVVSQKPFNIGYTAVKNAVLLARGDMKSVPADDQLSPVIYSTDNPGAIRKYLTMIKKAH